MGSAESKVAAQPPLAVVVSPNARGYDTQRHPVVLCNFLRKQNKTAPVPRPAAPAASAPPTLPSSPTIEAVKEAKKLSVVSSGGGPPAQPLDSNRVLSFHRLSFEELSTQLLKAVKNGDLKLVERIFEISATKQLHIINIRGMWESTPLIYACQYCHEPLALWLLQAGADVHLSNEKGVTALLLASLEGMAAAVHQMLLQLADTTPTRGDAHIPIDAQVGVVYNSMTDVNVRASPLLAASMNGHVEVVCMLLQHGADVNCGVSTMSVKSTSSGHQGARERGGGGGEGGKRAQQFPLLVAAKHGHSAVVHLLIKSGASVRETDGNDNHALLLACEAAKEDCALTLLRHLPVADHAVWKRPNRHGFTALHYSAVHGLVKAVECMLQQLQWKDDSAFLNAVSSTRHECAVLMASRKKQIEVVKLLLQCDADALLADRGGTTALDVLKREKRDDVVLLWQELQQQLRQTEKLTGPVEFGANAEIETTALASVPGTKDTTEPEELLAVKLVQESAQEASVVRVDALHSELVLRDQEIPSSISEKLRLPAEPKPQPYDASVVERAPLVHAFFVTSNTVVEAALTALANDPLADSPVPSSVPVDDAVENESNAGQPEAGAPSEAHKESHAASLTAVAGNDSIDNNAETSPVLSPTLLVPQRPSSSQAAPATSKKTHNRRGTGHVSQDTSALAKRLVSRAGTMPSIATAVEDGEGYDDRNSTPTASLLNDAALGSPEHLVFASSANDRTAAVTSHALTFSRELAPELAVPTIENEDSSHGAAGETPLPVSMASSSPSPRRERDKHKKKKRHSRKKTAEDEDGSVAKDKPVALSSHVSKRQSPEEATELEEDDRGALDDDF